jgi:NADH-quinone oxidoreductase subunit E
MLRRLHKDQPDSFAFTPANLAWAEAQITKYPEGRQASAIIPLLWRAQEQYGWLTRPAIEYVSDMLGMAYIRGLEVASCSNAPMAQIGKDYYEDLTKVRMGEIIDELAAGDVPLPGPQNGRYASEPLNGLSSLVDYDSGKTQYNASVQLASDIGDTVKRIDGTEVPLIAPWPGKHGSAAKAATKPATAKKAAPKAAKAETAPKAAAKTATAPIVAEGPGKKPKVMKAPRKAGADDLKMIKGVGPKLEGLLNDMGFFHFDQVSKWGADEVSWVDQNLEGFKGRVSRDNWVSQATALAAGEETEFSKRAKKDGTCKK